MGFYGNISNATRTQFNFDRIYSNRYAMEALQTTDGVYAGRYILIEYDKEATEDCFRKVTKINNNLFYSEGEYAEAQLTKSNTKDKQIVYVENSSTKKKEFYIIKHDDGFKYENVAANESNYVVNYNVDLTYYFGSSGGRGYDSTVWQKVYTEGTEKYVMVAELNTVVPTFEVTADSPSMSPRLPHFDADSTNVYYKLHWQPQWGLRIKGAKNYKTPMLNSDGTQVSIKNADGTETISYTDASIDSIDYPSDMYTSWSRYEYNRVNNEEKTYYASENEKGGVNWTEDFSQALPGAIYFNKAGFDPAKITYFKDHYNIDNPKALTTYNGGNKISLQPTGISGHRYNTHGLGFDPVVEEDIQELSIMLPGVGDAVAKLWDLVYGGETVNSGRNRNMDISWDSTGGHRLVTNRADGNGFEYNDDERVETLAGCINSVHDLMGMIITNLGSTKPEEASSLQDNQIYYFNGEYLRKKEIFDYNPNGVTYVYEEVKNLTASDYEPGTYFISNGNGYIPDSGVFNSNTKYYIRKITVGTWQVINPKLLAWQPNVYYTKSLSGNYYLAKDELASYGESYYTIQLVKQELGEDYYPDKFHYIDEKGNYIFSRDESLTEGRNYYQVPEEKFVENTTINYWNVLPFELGKYVYQAGEKTNSETGEKEPIWKIENEGFKTDRKYYIADIEKITDNTYQYDESTGQYVPVVLETVLIRNQREVTLVDLGDKNKQYFIKEAVTKINPETQLEEILNYNYIKITAPEYDDWGYVNTQIKYYEGIGLNELQPITSFYQPNKFYFKDINQNYVKDTRATARPNTDYYLVSKETKMGAFYVPYVYYYLNKDTGKYEIDTRRQKMETDYYTGGDYYVEKDEKKVFAQGSLWNNNVKIVPSSITLATRDSHFELEPLVGFARTLNTIHGLILKVNDMLEMDDLLTRNTSTVQGVINRLNDVLVKFDELIPREFLVVDDYGRAHSASFTTDQSASKTISKSAAHDSLTTGIIADKYDIVSDENSPTQWITTNIDGNPISPKVTIHHNFNPVDNRDTTSNKNPETRTATNKGIHNNNNDTLTLYHPIIDQMGHIVGTDTDIVTLPYGFKYFKTDGKASAVTDIDPSGVTSIIADNTQDTLEISPFNKWIQMRFTPAADAGATKNDDILEIAHEVHTITTSKKTDTDLNNPITNTITVQDLLFDEAGHVTANQAHTYTLPYGFKTITVGTPAGTNTTDYSTTNNTSIVADNTQDTLTINSDNKWIRIAGNKDTDVLTFAHEIHNITTTAKGTTDLNGADNKTFTVQDLAFDAAGHVTANQSHTYTLPYNFKQVTIGQESTSINDVTHASGNLIAESHVDTLTITPSNRWIRLSANANNDSFTIGHSHAGSDTNRLYGNSSALTPNFGGTFKVPYIGVDEAGHVNTQNHFDITIPKPSLTTTGSTTSGASLVTDISLTPETGAFAETRANVGTLTLSGYSLGNSAEAIKSTDSINTAFSKLQLQMNNEVSNRGKAIDGLNKSDAVVAGQYVSAVTQEKGIITVQRESLPDYSQVYAPLEGNINSTSEFEFITGAADDSQKTIAWLFKKVADLEARLNELTTV